MPLLPPPSPIGPFGRVSLSTLMHLVLALLVVFLLTPALDLGVSGLFHDPERGFWMDNWPPVEIPRQTVRWLGVLFALGAAIRVLAHPLLNAAARARTRIWAVIALLVALGPGVMANAVFKAFWGRPRPRHITQFGGDWTFTPPFQMTGECLRNCSFVSGEGSGAMAFAIALVLLAMTTRHRLQCRVLLALAPVIALTGSALRVMMGGHFLSDVLFAMLFTWIVAEILLRLIPLGALAVPGDVTSRPPR